MRNKRTMFVGTLGSVQKIFGVQGYDSAVTPAALDVVEQAQRGSADLAPVRIVNGLVYQQRQQRKLLELYYDFMLDLDTATELTARARHLTIGGILDMDYQQEPLSLLWCARVDGVLLACSYYREQQFIAWSAHQLGGGGAVESLCCIPGPAPGADQLWLIVRRTIDGATVRYVEVLDDFNALDIPDPLYTTSSGYIVPDAGLRYLDCYANYEGAPATNISGLGYLEGASVAAMSAGIPIMGLVVAGGAITVPPTSDITVGFDYAPASRLAPMPIEAGAREGTSKGQMKRIDHLRAGLFRSGSFYYGDGKGKWDLLAMRRAQDAMDQPVPLFTGPRDLGAFPGDYEREVEVHMMPNGPLPHTVLWLTPRLNTMEG